MPHQPPGQQGGTTRARRVPHRAGFRWLEGQGKTQRRGGHKVDPQDLHRRHRQGHPGKKGHDNRRRLAKAGGQGPTDHLLDIVVDRAPFADGGGDRGEIVIGQDQIGGLLRGLAAFAAHGDAGIGPFEGRGVIHPVAGHCHGQAARLQRLDQTQFMRGRGAGEHIDLRRRIGQSRIAHRFQFRAGQNPAGVFQPDVLRNGAGGLGMVAGDHLHRDPGRVTFGNRRDGLGAGWIDQPDQANQGQLPLNILGGQDRLVLWHGAHGDGDHPLPVSGQTIDHGVPMVGGQRLGSALGAALGCAHVQHRLWRAFDMHKGLPLMVVVKHRHIAMRGIERDCVRAGPIGKARAMRAGDFARKRQKRAFHRVTLNMPAIIAPAQGRIVAQHGGAGHIAQRTLRFYGVRARVWRQVPLGGIAVAADLKDLTGKGQRRRHHLVPGQGAGLIGTNHRNRAQCFNGGQAAHDGITACHGLHPHGQRDGQHRGKPLGYCRN